MDPQPLDYRTPSNPLKKQKWGPAPTDPESRRWRLYRGLFRFVMLVIFLPIALYFGPNLMNFGKFTPLSIDDFVPLVQRDDMPVIQALKQYERDTGQLPDDIRKIAPKYLPARPSWRADVFPDQKVAYFYEQLHETVVYKFDPAKEGWSVQGYFVSGPVPVPPVMLPPLMHR